MSSSSPEVVISPEVARRLLVEGATLFFLNVPEGTQFGIDMKMWDTGEKFKGVKMIPPGVHMIHYSASGKYGDVAPKVSFLHNFKKSEVLVKKWDIDSERMSLETVSDEEVARFKTNLLNLDHFLGAYPFETYDLWQKLSKHISDSVLNRLLPECGVISSALELISMQDRPKPVLIRRLRTVDEREEELLPKLRPTPGTEIRFTPMPMKTYPDGSTPQDITKHSLDLSYTLDSMIGDLGDPREIVGEIQFAFVSFLVGQSLESFEAWKNLVRLLCNCREAVTRRRQLYVHFLQALETQLAQVPEDFLVDIVSSNNVIYVSLRELFKTMAESSSIEGRLRCEAQRLQERLTEKFCWDFQDLELETGDEAPVIVELEAQG
ncbi:protein AAR2 homolog [Cimex lectularius]|uniref:Protein AAR2 homolog n=1 Tax=Cimex lectularius TaxID=79782 RepID=A0A8I6RX97_CIMLE|nr:protein AAR2 homolog [Cimex lectularius]